MGVLGRVALKRRAGRSRADPLRWDAAHDSAPRRAANGTTPLSSLRRCRLRRCRLCRCRLRRCRRCRCRLRRCRLRRCRLCRCRL
ncbi:MAG: hypothetical protein CSB49_02175, partial [Proteobacteria bacterium]